MNVSVIWGGLCDDEMGELLVPEHILLHFHEMLHSHEMLPSIFYKYMGACWGNF